MGRIGLNLILVVSLTACDDTSIGNLNEDPGPPRLLRIIAQPAKRTCTRCAITDLLDTTPPVACSADSPCPVSFQVKGHPAPSCHIAAGQITGVCTDPLAAAPVGIGAPTEGNSIRLVFSKSLDPALNQPADMMNPPLLVPGIVEIDDPAGMPVMTTAFYDPSGSELSDDPIGEPFGPAIEIDIKTQLAPATSYTLKLDASKIHDRKGQIPVGISGIYTVTFTTESDLALMGVVPDVRPTLDMAAMKPAIAPDDVLQLAFNVPLADPQAMGAKATAVLKQGDTVIPSEMWLDAGAPGHCAVNKFQLDIVAVSTPGTPAMLAPGQYTLTISNVVDGVAGHSTAYDTTFTFFVAGTPDPTHDKSSFANFYVPGAMPCM
jgi:hypothetical protein